MPTSAYKVVLGLGANLGDRLANLRRATERLDRAAGVTVEACSSVYETPPAGGPPQPSYLNAAVRVRTALEPAELLACTLEIERSLGRHRPDKERWGPRTIDIDLLWCSLGAVQAPGLTIPHPRLAGRAFALVPLLELVPDARDPEGRRYAELPAASEALERVAALDASGRERGI